MIAELLGLPEDPFSTFLTLSLGGILTYLLMASGMYAWLFVYKRRHFHPDYRPKASEIRREIKWSFFSVIGNAVLMSPFQFFIAQGNSLVYFDIDDYGWWYVPISIAAYVAITETLIYFTHWGLHRSSWLYNNIHKPHHSFRVTTSYAGVAFNPLDSFAQALPHHLCTLILPVHISVYLFFVGLVTVWAVMIHDGVSFVRWRGINYTGHHTLHHWYADYNFGQFFTFWDRIMKTYKDPEIAYADIPIGIVQRYEGGELVSPPGAGQRVSDQEVVPENGHGVLPHAEDGRGVLTRPRMGAGS